MILTAGALMLGGCASSGGETVVDVSPAAARQVGFVGMQEGGNAVDGGTLTFGSYSFPQSLDPTKVLVSGSTGGSEMGAIYDTLLRSDPETGGFEPQLAKSMSQSEDNLTFTITLRDDVTFSDGTALDAQAVKWSIDRYVAAKNDVAKAWTNIVESVETPDQSTVVFTLKGPWTQFPVLLATGPGMIVGQGADAGDTFTPIGAGPFTLTKFAPNEEIALAPRAGYYGGKPHLDKLRFVPTSGAQSQLESLKSGQLNMAFILRDEGVIKAAKDAGYAGYADSLGLGAVGVINNRDGHPGSDLRVRRAIAYGVDPELIDERANKGLGVAESTIFPSTSRWNTGAEGLQYDPQKAKELLAQAKADGYDGKLSYLATNEPTAEAAALATQASLNAIGFDVTIDYATDTSDLVRKLYVDHDFDMGRAAFSVLDDAPYLRLYNSLSSVSTSSPSGYKDAKMDSLLSEVQFAQSDEGIAQAIAAVQTRMNETVPFSVWGPQSIFVAWDANVYGVKRTVDSAMLFDKTWIGPK